MTIQDSSGMLSNMPLFSMAGGILIAMLGLVLLSSSRGAKRAV